MREVRGRDHAGVPSKHVLRAEVAAVDRGLVDRGEDRGKRAAVVATA
jgi:hypothetical protein